MDMSLMNHVIVFQKLQCGLPVFHYLVETLSMGRSVGAKFTEFDNWRVDLLPWQEGVGSRRK